MKRFYKDAWGNYHRSDEVLGVFVRQSQAADKFEIVLRLENEPTAMVIHSYYDTHNEAETAAAAFVQELNEP